MSKLKKLLVVFGVVGAVGSPVALYFGSGGSISDIETIKELITASLVGFVSGTGGTGLVYYLLTNGFRKTNTDFKEAIKSVERSKQSIEETKQFILYEQKRFLNEEVKPLLTQNTEALNKVNEVIKRLDNGIVKVVESMQVDISKENEV